MELTVTRAVLAMANYTVCALNLRAWLATHEARDFWAMAAWFGSGSFWAWQAIVG